MEAAARHVTAFRDKPRRSTTPHVPSPCRSSHSASGSPGRTSKISATVLRCERVGTQEFSGRWPLMRSGRARWRGLLPSAVRIGSAECWTRYTRRAWSVALAPLLCKHGAPEAGHTPSQRSHRVTRIDAEVVNPVVARLVPHVWNDFTGAGSSVRQRIHSSVGLRHIVEGDPAREVLGVWIVDKVGILVPAELQAPFGGLDHILLVE